MKQVDEKLSFPRCATCRHWQEHEDEQRSWDLILYPYHPGTHRPTQTESEAAKVFGYRVRYCRHPKIEFWQRPQVDGACVVDGSEYRAELITGEQFGCVLHEQEESK
jgi:hypothetical protein